MKIRNVDSHCSDLMLQLEDFEAVVQSNDQKHVHRLLDAHLDLEGR